MSQQPDRTIVIRVTDEVFRAIEAAAARAGLRKTTYLREMIVSTACPEYLDETRLRYGHWPQSAVEAASKARAKAEEEEYEREQCKVRIDTGCLPLPDVKLTDEEILAYLKRGVKADYLCARYRLPWKRVYGIKDAINV